MDAREIAKQLRRAFPNLIVVLDKGDRETHLPFVTVHRGRHQSPIAVISCNYLGQWSASGIAAPGKIARGTAVHMPETIIAIVRAAADSK